MDWGRGHFEEGESPERFGLFKGEVRERNRIRTG